MKLFGEERIEDLLGVANRYEKIDALINREARSEIIDDAKSHAIGEKIYREVHIEPLNLVPVVDSISPSEISVSAERFPSNFNVEKGKSYVKPCVAVHMKAGGNIQLLQAKLDHRTLGLEAERRGDSIVFNVIDFDYDAETLRNRIERQVANIAATYKEISTFVDSQNDGFKSQISERIKQRKAEYLAQDKKLRELDYPVKGDV